MASQAGTRPSRALQGLGRNLNFLHMLWKAFKEFHKGIKMDWFLFLKGNSGCLRRIAFKEARQEAGHLGQKLSSWSKHMISPMAGTRTAVLDMKRNR